MKKIHIIELLSSAIEGDGIISVVFHFFWLFIRLIKRNNKFWH